MCHHCHHHSHHHYHCGHCLHNIVMVIVFITCALWLVNQTCGYVYPWVFPIDLIRKNQLFLLHLITSYSSYFGGKKGISGNKTSFFLLMLPLPVKICKLPGLMLVENLEVGWIENKHTSRDLRRCTISTATWCIICKRSSPQVCQ